MSLKSGFFNSVNHDRTYDAEDVASIFDGAFSDGVFFNVKINGSLDNNQHFYVTANGMGVNVGTGKAWFDHTYTINDEPLYLGLEEAEGVLNRYDAVVLEVNNTLQVRENTIKVVTGVAENEPQKPSMIKSTLINQYPLAYIYVPAGAESILQSNVENVVGTEETPYAAGLIPMNQDIPFSFGIDGNGRYGYKEVGSSEVTAFTPFKFGIDENGNYGYIKDGADTVTPFKTGGSGSGVLLKKVATVGSNSTINLINKEGFEEIWENLSTSNFFVLINGITVHKPRATGEKREWIQQWMTKNYRPPYSISLDELASNVTIKPVLSYNPDTGNLTVTGMNGNINHTSDIIGYFMVYDNNYGREREGSTKITSYTNYLTVSATIDIWVAY